MINRQTCSLAGSLVLAASLAQVAQAAATVSKSQMSRAPSDDSCNPPAAVTVFQPGDQEIWTYFLVDQAAKGDVPKIQWVDPTNAVVLTTPFDPIPSAGQYCFDDYLSTVTDLYKPVAGTWTAKMFWNDTALGSVRFQVAGVQPSPSLVVGGFNSSRIGTFGIDNNAPLRQAVVNAFPGSTFLTAPALTSAYLGTINALMIGTLTTDSSAVNPLSAAEQTALVSFVKGGGTALLFTDNSTFASQAPAANNSFLAPFGLSAVGTLNGFQASTIVNSSNAVITGPFGIATRFDTNFPGWFDNTGSAIVLSKLVANGQPDLAVLLPGALGPGSGAVVFFADQNNISHNSSSQAQTNGLVLILNSLALAKASSGGASFKLDTISARFPSGPSTGSVTVTASAATASWTASSNADWITITAGNSGVGNGTVRYSVADNSGNPSRSGTMTIAGLNFTVSQAGANVSGLPDGEACVSGAVDYIVFSLATSASRMPDEVSIGGTKLCPTCDLKPPIYGNFARKLEIARDRGLNVDACYDSFGTMNFVRLRPQ